MGIALQRWSFSVGAAPSLDEVCLILRRQTGLAPEIVDDRVRLVEVRCGFAWSREADIAEVRSGLPYHPYLWRQISLVMETLGGTPVWPDMQVNIWPRSGPEPVCLSKPWVDLTPFQQRVLRGGDVLMFRPFDRWL